jgi:hypothetical protein
MLMPKFVKVEEAEVNARLRHFSLDRPILIDAIRMSVAAYGGCTDNDPPSARGFEPWRATTRGLRELLGSRGYERDDSGNFSTIKHIGHGIRIVALNTDSKTGDPRIDVFPRNRLKKGILHELAIGAPDWLPGLPNPFAVMNSLDIWYLCQHINGDKVLAELSRPERIEDGFITSWRERLLILKPGDWKSVEAGGQGDDSGPEIEVDVQLR